MAKIFKIDGKEGRKARRKQQQAFRRENARRIKEMADWVAAYRARVRATA